MKQQLGIEIGLMTNGEVAVVFCDRTHVEMTSSSRSFVFFIGLTSGQHDEVAVLFF